MIELKYTIQLSDYNLDALNKINKVMLEVERDHKIANGELVSVAKLKEDDVVVDMLMDEPAKTAGLVGASTNANSLVEKVSDDELADAVEKASITLNSDPTITDLRDAVKKAKVDLGEEHIRAVFAHNNIDMKATVARTLSTIEPADYRILIKHLKMKTLPVPEPEVYDELDDELDDKVDTNIDADIDIDVESVKTALRAYAKETSNVEAKKIMKAHNINKLNEIEISSNEQLLALMKALV